MRWANFFHAYQPPGWDPKVIAKVARESYHPVLQWLVAHAEVRLTLNVTAVLLEQLREQGHAQVLRALSTLVERQQVELVGTASYHALLPLLPPVLAERQIAEQERALRGIFGVPSVPQGFFFPEMAYGAAVATTLHPRGYRWVLLDEICYNGSLGAAVFSTHYEDPATGLGVFFRNRRVSDYLRFDADLRRPEAFWEHVHKDGRSGEVLITAMDLENLGHHRTGLDAFWEDLVLTQDVETLTLSELSGHLTASETCSPRAASWSSQEDEVAAGTVYALWKNPNNPIHALQWQLVEELLTLAQREEGNADAQRALDRALNSDPFWWASAQPWWDGRIIEQAAQRLIAVSQHPSCSPAEVRHLQELGQRITTLVSEWNASGEPERRRRAYLTHLGQIRRMGGEVITA